MSHPIKFLDLKPAVTYFQIKKKISYQKELPTRGRPTFAISFPTDLALINIFSALTRITFSFSAISLVKTDRQLLFALIFFTMSLLIPFVGLENEFDVKAISSFLCKVKW